MGEDQKKAVYIKGEVTPDELVKITQRLRCFGCGADPPPVAVIIKQPERGKEQTDPLAIKMLVEDGIAPPEEGKPRSSIFGFCERCAKEKGLIKETGHEQVGG